MNTRPRSSKEHPRSLVVGTPLDRVVAELAAAGVAVEEGPVGRTGALGPMTSVYVRDPDRNLIELSDCPG